MRTLNNVGDKLHPSLIAIFSPLITGVLKRLLSADEWSILNLSNENAEIESFHSPGPAQNRETTNGFPQTEHMPSTLRNAEFFGFPQQSNRTFEIYYFAVINKMKV